MKSEKISSEISLPGLDSAPSEESTPASSVPPIVPVAASPAVAKLPAVTAELPDVGVPVPSVTLPEMREFTDAAAIRRNIYDRVLKATRELQPISNSRHTLRLVDVDYQDPETVSKKQQKQAILNNLTQSRRLRGTWELLDNETGEVVDRKKAVVMRVPHFTERGTFINKGVEYALKNQQRLLPGVYTRVQSNGEIESHANVMPGKGPAHRYYLDPEKGTFKIKIGQGTVGLLPLLRTMGISDSELQKAWGGQLYAANLKSDNAAEYAKLRSKFLSSTDLKKPISEQEEILRNKFAGMELDPEVTKRTLGAPYTALTADTLLAVTKKLIGVSKGEQEADDRDSLAFQRFYGPEDLLEERIRRDKDGIRRQLLWKMSNKGSLKSLQSGVLTPQLQSALISSGLGLALEEINPTEVMDKMTSTTRLGEGGIASVDAIPAEARSVQPSMLNFIDPQRTPESAKVGIDVYAARGAMKGSDGKLYSKFLDARTGEEIYKNPQQVSDMTVGFPDALKSADEYVPAMRQGKMEWVSKNELDLIVPHMEGAFNQMSNLIPMKSQVKAQRLVMATRMSVTGDAWVLILRTDGTSYHGPIESYVWQQGDLSPSIDKITHQLCWKEVKEKIVHKNTKKLWRVRTDSGRSVTTTSDHSFVTLADNGNLVKIKPTEMDRNTPIPCGILLDCPTVNTEAWTVPAGNKHNAHPSVSFALDFDFGWIVGLYLAEGYGNNDGNVVVFANIASEIQDRVKEFFESRGIPAAIRSGRSDKINDRIVVNWKQLYRKLRMDFGDGAYHKKLPSWALFAPKDFRQGILAGYLAGDGIVGLSVARSTTVGGGSRSKSLIQGLTALCGSLGIATTQHKSYVNTGPGGSSVWQYAFTVRKEHHAYLPQIGLPLKDAKLAHERACWSGKREADWLPVFSDMHAMVRRRLKREDKFSRRLQNRVRGSLTRQNIIALFGDDAPWASRGWSTSLVWWEHPKVVEPIDEQHEFVYDLDMADNVFMVNGIFVHNTNQALPLVNAEAPLVQSAVPGTDGKESFESLYGKFAGAVRADKAGQVVSVTDDEVKVRYADGTEDVHELYNMHPYNRKTFLHQTPTVQPGDMVQPGQLLAKSNFTDKTGATAVGLNARTAYMAWEGKNFEDAIVISKSFANRLKSEHMYQHQLETDDKVEAGKKKFLQVFPGTFSKKTLENIDNSGVIKPGTEVKYGDPLILGISKKESSHNRIHRKGATDWADASVLWEHHDPGVVTDVAMTSGGPLVVVKSTSTMQVGDKLSARYGDKGVISAIIDDEDMPSGADGRPYEVLLNPLGIVTRINPSQTAELFLGKLAEKLGHPIAVEDFDSEKDMSEWVLEQLRKHDLKDVEDVLDPSTGRKVKDIATGNRFFMKLHHMAESKLQGRSGGAYSMDESPAKGGTEGCFAPKQRILTSLGYKRISEIVEKKLGCQVLTFSEKLQDWVYRPVVDWFTYRAKVSDLITVHTLAGPCVRESSVNRTHGCLTVTRNHEVFTYDGRKVTAGELTCRDQLVTWGPVPTQHQRDFLAGTLLGDATADFNGVSMEHSRKQVKYVNWKQSVLAGLNAKFCDTVHDMSDRPGFKTKRRLARVVWTAETHVADYYTKLCYDGNHVKRVTDEWLRQLSDLSIAVWVLDDGSIGNRSKKKGKIRLGGHIYIQGFDHVSRCKLNDWLNNRLGTANSINTIGAISLTVAACHKLVDIIAEWVPWEVIPKSKLCLRRMVKEIQKNKKPREIESVCRMGKVPLIISEIAPYIHDKPGITDISVYDFTVQETHTYIASTALVSNSKRLGLLESNALLAHGGLASLQDASIVRGQRNDEYWMQFMSGYNPTAVKVPFAYRKFVNQLKASGINVTQDGPQINIMALTDKDIAELAGDRELTSAEGVDWAKGLKEIEGGLFDKGKTGGHSGNGWSYFKLKEPMPNPVLEEPIRRILGLTGKKFEAVLAGQEELQGFGKGPHAIKKALESINIDREIENQRAIIRSGRVSYRDAAIKKLGLLKSAKKNGIHPSEYMLTKVPVLPPLFRPVAMMSNDMPLVDDANHLYKELFEANKNLERVSTLLGDDNASEERLAVYKAFKAVTGLGDPIGIKNKEQGVKGILSTVFGSSPKYSTLQRRLISTTVDNVGRGVITPNPSFDMDTIGIPENSAYKIYDRPLTRRLVRRGMSVRAAREEIESRSKLAQQALLEEMEERPVIASRAPVLHKFGVLAFKPKLVKSNTLETSPLIVKGLGADYDGDAMNFHVPATDRAVAEAYERLLPSKNLFKLSDMKSVMHAPANEYIAGLHHATSSRSERPKQIFRNIAEVREAYARRAIAIDDPIQILEQ